jgi:hypothetical protein
MMTANEAWPTMQLVKARLVSADVPPWRDSLPCDDRAGERQIIDLLDGTVAESPFETQQVSRDHVGLDMTTMTGLALSNRVQLTRHCLVAP